MLSDSALSQHCTYSPLIDVQITLSKATLYNNVMSSLYLR